MLDTGIDVPEVVNLVFFKPVRSKTKFWQMVGRGTRLCAGLFGPGEDKQDFFIFDVCENLAFFNQDVPELSGGPGPSLRARMFGERLELVVALADATGEGDGTVSERGLREDLVTTLREQVAGMNVDNFLVRPHRRLVERYREPSAWRALELDGALELGAGVADLPSAVRDDDEDAKRFDLILLRLQLCRLRAEPGQERLRRQVQEVAAGLLEQLAIPAVREQQELLSGRNLTADQHDFVALVVEHLTANGAMDVGLLYEPPFTSVAAGGPETLSPDIDVDALIDAIRAVGENARPRDEAA